MHEIDEAKTKFNARAKAEMDIYLRSKTWVEKVESIERMRERSKIARESMRKALEKQTANTNSLESKQPGSE